ncbi:helix-turn-helix transcriptional regulator [Aquimarina sp. I32.4]|uniref:ArsR/SmtB family transcription factor n=1 Tax=Aquimarina sp. I32.4 TaxID=2053903 RepID=UPI000CDEAFCD|nr:ArsR family transcriptional regulator [Aquimarina sp. I32.4]
MRLTKSEFFTTEQNEIAQIAKVLGHPVCVAIIEHLTKIQSCICGDLVEVINLAQPTISQYLKELKNIGIIKESIEGVRFCNRRAKLESYSKTLFFSLFSIK